MLDNKLLTVLKALKPTDLNAFGKYVHSPYFNVNPYITLYFDFLEVSIRNNTTNDLDAKILWQKVYDNAPYQHQKFLKINSDLTSLLEDFLAQQEYDANLSLRTSYKLAAVGKRQITRLYNGILGDAARLEKMEMNQSAEYYLQRYQIEKNILNFKLDENAYDRFALLTNNLDVYFIAEKLRQYSELLTRKKMFKIEHDPDHMEFVLNLANSDQYQGEPAVRVYYLMYLTFLEEENTDHYFNLKGLIRDYIHLFPIEEQREIYSVAISYCVNKGNKNVGDFHIESFEIYKDALERNVLTNENELPKDHFINIVPIALRASQYDWTENFIYEYSKFLEERERQNAVEFSLARLEFYRKNFQKVLDHLNKVNYEDVWYSLISKTNYVLTYYELEEFDVLESFLQSFKMFVRREKSLTAARKEHYLNLIKFTGALVRINPKDQKKLLKLQADIEDTKGVVNKPWLLEKVGGLIKGRK